MHLSKGSHILDLLISIILQIKMLHKIGGASGRSDGTKVLRSIVGKLILPEFMSSISWTGKSGGKGSKIKFSKYDNIIWLISTVCIAADKKFTEQMVIQDLKYKVLKYAYSRSQTPLTEDVSMISRPASTDPIIQGDVLVCSGSSQIRTMQQHSTDQPMSTYQSTSMHQPLSTYQPTSLYQPMPTYPPTYYPHGTYYPHSQQITTQQPTNWQSHDQTYTNL